MLEDRSHVGFPVEPLDPVAGSLQPEQRGAGDLLRELLALPDREHRVRGAVDDERGHRDRRDRLGRNVALRDHGVVLGGGDVTRALDVAADELTPRHLVKGTHAPRKHPLVGHQVLDHRPSVRPIHLS